jgi:hypothetical protein
VTVNGDHGAMAEEALNLSLTLSKTVAMVRAQERGRRGGAARKVNRKMAPWWRSTTLAGDVVVRGGGSEGVLGLCCCGSVGGNDGEQGGADMLAAMKASVEGRGGHRMARCSSAPAHGGHGARGSCRGRARHASAGERARRARPASAVGQEAGRRPVKQEKLFSFLNSILKFSNSFKFQILK